jgi:hypothetical protein
MLLCFLSFVFPPLRTSGWISFALKNFAVQKNVFTFGPENSLINQINN